MLKFYYSEKESFEGGVEIEMSWDGEEDIWDILEKFKSFLLAKTYSPDLELI